MTGPPPLLAAMQPIHSSYVHRRQFFLRRKRRSPFPNRCIVRIAPLAHSGRAVIITLPLPHFWRAHRGHSSMIEGCKENLRPLLHKCLYLIQVEQLYLWDSVGDPELGFGAINIVVSRRGGSTLAAL